MVVANELNKAYLHSLAMAYHADIRGGCGVHFTEKESGDDRTQNQRRVVEHYIIHVLPYVSDLAQRLQHRYVVLYNHGQKRVLSLKGISIQEADLINEGIACLIKRFGKYKPGNNIIMFTKLHACSAMYRYGLKQSMHVAVPYRIHGIARRVISLSTRREDAIDTFRKAPYCAETGEDDSPLASVRASLLYYGMTGNARDLFAPTKGRGDYNTLEAVLGDEINHEEAMLLSDALQKAFTCLEERELDVIEGMFGFFGITMTRDELGRKWGVSGTRIGQLKDRALRKLHEQLQQTDGEAIENK